MGLALSPEVTALGEVSEFGRVKPEQHECTCGVLFGQCRLWGDLLREAAENDLSGVEVLARAIERANELESTHWCVDSVKNDAGFEAERALGLEDTRLVYLVRHPCGYAYSMINTGLEFDYAVDAWIHEQESTLALLAELKRPSLTIRYEQLARDPGRTLAQIAEFAGIVGPLGERGAPWAWEQASWGTRQHILCGAAWRLHGRPSAVREDVRWKHALHPGAQAKIFRLCAGLLRELGYGDEASS